MNSSVDSAGAGTIGGARSKLRSSSCCRQIWCVTTCVQTAPCAGVVGVVVGVVAAAVAHAVDGAIADAQGEAQTLQLQ